MKIKHLLLFFLLSGIGIPYLSYMEPNAVAFDLEGVQAGNFAPGQLEAHYAKHGDQFGSMTQEQYLQEARQLLNASPGVDILEKIRYNGDIEHFRVSTGEFAVMTKRGRIRTLFKTSYAYWMRQQ